MKIVQINSVSNLRSTGKIAEGISEEIVHLGWESYMAYGRYAKKSDFAIEIKIGNKFDQLLHLLKSRFFDLHGFGSKIVTWNLIRKIKKIDPHIIHLHNLHGYYINISILFKYIKKANIPVVWTLHDCWTFTGHCSYFEYVGCDKWMSQCHSCPQLFQYPKSYLDNSRNNFINKKKIFSSVENITFVPVSYWLHSILSKSFFKDYSAQVIQNGIDLSVFKPIDSNQEIRDKYTISEEFIILGVASVWDERKGIKFFYKLAEKLTDNYKVVLIGLDAKQLRDLPSNILGISRTDNIQQLVAWYAIANVFVNPTLEDTFPTTNLEALACGTPVITFETGGSVESVSEDTGFVVEKENVDALQTKIKIITTKGKSFYSAKCRERATLLYDKNQKFKEYTALYKQILNKN